MEGYCKQQLIRVNFLCALTLVDFVLSILTLTALLVILHVSTEVNKPLYLFWVRQDRCKLFYSLKWFCSCYFESYRAGVCPQSKDWMKGEVLIFSSSVGQRMLKDGFALKTRKWRGIFISLSFEQRSEKGNDNKKNLLRLKISKKQGASVIQTSQVYNNQESIWNLSIFHQEHISNRVTHWCVFSGGRKSAFERKYTNV